MTMEKKISALEAILRMSITLDQLDDCQQRCSDYLAAAEMDQDKFHYAMRQLNYARRRKERLGEDVLKLSRLISGSEDFPLPTRKDGIEWEKVI